MSLAFYQGGKFSPGFPPADSFMAQHLEMGQSVTLTPKTFIKEGVQGRRELAKGLRKGPKQDLP